MSALLSLGSAAGARTSLTLLVLAIAARFGALNLPEHLDFLSHNVGLALLVAFVVVEELVEQDEDLQEIMGYVNYVVRGAGGALASSALESLGGENLPPFVPALVGAGVAVATHHLRMQMYEVVRGLGESLWSPRTWLAWLEAGGVVGVVVAVFLAPALSLAFVIMASLGAVALIVIRRAAERRLRRRDCPACGVRIRVEARLCPACKSQVPIVVVKGSVGSTAAAPAEVGVGRRR